jgi:hypothetical protein
VRLRPRCPGLFFIAFSFRLQDLQLSRVIRTRARYLVWLIAIAVSSVFVVVPGQSRAALAAEILALTAGCMVYTAWSALRSAQWEPSPFSGDLVGRRLGMGQPGCSASGRASACSPGMAAGCTFSRSRCCSGSPSKSQRPGAWLCGSVKDTRGQDIMPGATAHARTAAGRAVRCRKRRISRCTWAVVGWPVNVTNSIH